MDKPRIALLSGGPMNGESLDLAFGGKYLRYPGDDEDGGRYRFASASDDDILVYRWEVTPA